MKRKGENGKVKARENRSMVGTLRAASENEKQADAQRPYIDELEQFKDYKVGLKVKTAEQGNTKTKH